MPKIEFPDGNIVVVDGDLKFSGTSLTKGEEIVFISRDTDSCILKNLAPYNQQIILGIFPDNRGTLGKPNRPIIPKENHRLILSVPESFKES